MKKLFSALFCFFSLLGLSQKTSIDSLSGFDVSKAVLKAHQIGLEGSEVKFFVKREEREFLKKTFALPETNSNATTASKYSTNFITNYPCTNEDFEASSNGATSISGWTVNQTTYGNSAICGSVNYGSNTSAVVVYTTPVTDANVNNVPTSPLGGTKVVTLNKATGLVGRISQTFSVTNSNWYYLYAYKAAISVSAHQCCEEACIIFNFFDCSNNPLTSLSQTITTNTSCSYSSAATWSYNSSAALYYTPNWVLQGVNLSSYIGSCVRVEVIASQCMYGAHFAYCYYDAQCTTGAIMVNGDISSGNSYSTCANTATLSGISGPSTYLWQGPSTSSISNSTSSVITTNVGGNYTLTTGFGTFTATQTVNLVLNNVAPVSITGTNIVCQGNSATLQATGGSGTYSWSTGSQGSSIVVTPSATTVYTVSSSSSGCSASDSKTITVSPMPNVQLIASSPTLCNGQNATIIASGSGSSYLWNTGSTAVSITVSPQFSSAYSCTVTNSAGCNASNSIYVAVYSIPQVTLSPFASTLCSGQTVTLSANSPGGPGMNTYHWSNGATTGGQIISPTQSSVYSVTVTNIYGCSSSTSALITVNPNPQIQLVASGSSVCLGQSVNFIVLGNNIGSILWNTGSTTQSISTTPTLSGVYSVTVTSNAGCTSHDSKTITVNPIPQVYISSPVSIICKGESMQLVAYASQGVSFLWSYGPTTSSVLVSPSVTTTYSLTVSDNIGCSKMTTYLVTVDPCLGLNNLTKDKVKELEVFPNPAGESFTVKSQNITHVQVVNELGQLITEFNLSSENNYARTLNNYAKGVYFVRTNSETLKLVIK